MENQKTKNELQEEYLSYKGTTGYEFIEKIKLREILAKYEKIAIARDKDYTKEYIDSVAAGYDADMARGMVETATKEIESKLKEMRLPIKVKNFIKNKYLSGKEKMQDVPLDEICKLVKLINRSEKKLEESQPQ